MFPKDDVQPIESGSVAHELRTTASKTIVLVLWAALGSLGCAESKNHIGFDPIRSTLFCETTDQWIIWGFLLSRRKASMTSQQIKRQGKVSPHHLVFRAEVELVVEPCFYGNKITVSIK